VRVECPLWANSGHRHDHSVLAGCKASNDPLKRIDIVHDCDLSQNDLADDVTWLDVRGVDRRIADGAGRLSFIRAVLPWSLARLVALAGRTSSSMTAIGRRSSMSAFVRSRYNLAP
jgi:hypothetical protein